MKLNSFSIASCEKKWKQQKLKASQQVCDRENCRQLNTFAVCATVKIACALTYGYHWDSEGEQQLELGFCTRKNYILYYVRKESRTISSSRVCNLSLSLSRTKINNDDCTHIAVISFESDLPCVCVSKINIEKLYEGRHTVTHSEWREEAHNLFI